MFEITTALQDLLDQAAQHRAHDVPALDQERANQQAAVTRQANAKQEEKRKEKHQANIEEEQYLAEMVEKQKTREERRREKLQSVTSQDPDAVAGKLAFLRHSILQLNVADQMELCSA